MDTSTPIQFVKGVGPKRAQTFILLGVNTLADLFKYFPRDWVFMPEPIKIEQARPGKEKS
jgi:ATP-dependent DNA helicase RecG